MFAPDQIVVRIVRVGIPRCESCSDPRWQSDGASHRCVGASELFAVTALHPEKVVESPDVVAFGDVDVIGEVVTEIVLQRQRLVVRRCHASGQLFGGLPGERAVVVG